MRPKRVGWRHVVGIVSGVVAGGVLAWDWLGFGSPGLHIEQALVALFASILCLACLLGRRSAAVYRKTALLVVNTAVFFLLLNLGLAVVYEIVDHLPHRADPISQRYPDVALGDVYADLDDQEIWELLRIWSHPFQYEPYTQFKMSAYRSRFVNIDPHGFRESSDQAKWPPATSSYNIFVFGGSTTFCFGLPDEQTVASRLQQRLRAEGHNVNVYNFGRGLYYSTQEHILMERLLMKGHRPDLAIFIDGLNEFRRRDEPSFTDRLVEFMEEGRSKPRALEGWPVRRLTDSIADSSVGQRRPDSAAGASSGGDGTSESVAHEAIERYLRNLWLTREVGELFEVETVFVWQPVPMYAYSLQHHLFASGVDPKGVTNLGYAQFAERLEREHPEGRFIWCADIQKDLRRPLYVDAVHYGPELATRLADCVVDGLSGVDLDARVVSDARD